MMGARLSGKNLAGIGACRIRHEQRVAGRAAVIHDAGAVSGPSQVDNISKKRTRLTAHYRHEAKSVISSGDPDLRAVGVFGWTPGPIRKVNETGLRRLHYHY